ncbi:MAG: hypothetical protein ABRQ38_10775 [Candidatus Eremiobacterota bacterium]
MLEEKVLNIKIPKTLHRSLKIRSASSGLTLKDITIKALTEYLKKAVNLIDEELIIEPVTDEDEPIIERARQEYARGEYQEFDEMIRELENESNSNEVG